MGMFDHFPYTNFHELNLDWILQALKEIEKTMDQFVAINALKYADPIQWNITTQYEKNTIVIDPLTGSAYISVQPVPTGVAITNTDYWSIVFDLSMFIIRAAKNFTDRWESQWTLTATFPSTVGDWLVWNDTLYRVISNIVAGDQYVINSNIQHFTIEELIGHLEDLTTSDKSSIVIAINELVTDLNNFINDIRGAIAINELDSTTATVNIPAGSMLWVSDQLYMSLIPISVGDTFVSGTNITPVNANDFILDRINNAVTNAVNNIHGSIAINEGSSTTATVNIPAGNMVWISDELYMSLTPISVGDTFVSGTNITPVSVNDFILDRVNNAENRVRGSIGLNELDSSVATQNITAGSLVWVSGELYMTLTNINAGDTFISGTNITPVKVDSYIQTLNNAINTQITNINNKLEVTNAGTQPRILTVGSVNCNFTTINAAITFARNYCTVSNRVTLVLMPGLYNEEVDLTDNPGIDLFGIGDAQINVSSSYPNAPLLFSGSMSCQNIQFINRSGSGGAYAVHYEAQLSPLRIGNQIRFINCVFGSAGHSAIGAGFGDGDDALFLNCRFYHYNNRAAVYMHNYPAGATYGSNIRFDNCLFWTPTDTAIRIDNARARAGSAGTSDIAFTFKNCTAAKSCNYVSLVLDAADSYVGYIPVSGEIALTSDSVQNTIIGLNYDSAGSHPWYDCVIFGALHGGRYVGGIHMKDQKDYDITLYSLKTYDGDNDITNDTVMNLSNDDSVVLICTNAVYTTEIPGGAQAIFALVPKKRATLIP